VIAKDTPEHHEVVGECGLFFCDSGDLAQKIQLILADEAMAEGLRLKAWERAKNCYSWDAITDAYEKLFQQLVNGFAL